MQSNLLMNDGFDSCLLRETNELDGGIRLLSF
jgi:hypothetical protein